MTSNKDKNLIIELKNHRIALEDNKSLLNSILNCLPDLIFVKDTKHRWIIINDAFCSAFGRTREELLGKSDYDIHSKAQADIFWEKDDLAFKTGKRIITEEVVTDADGNLRTIVTTKTPFHDRDGKLFLIGIAHDITERRQIQQSLENSNQYLFEVIDFLPDPTFVIDTEGTVSFWNRAMESSTRIKKDQILGKTGFSVGEVIYGYPRPTLANLVLNRNKALEQKYLELSEKNGRLSACTSFIHQETGKIHYFECTAARLYDSEGKLTGAIESLRNITDKKTVEIEREKLLKELQSATSEILTLSGLLPICSSCKKIRDDSGYWEQIESYLAKHTGADFSHGLCPICAKKLYGKHGWFKDVTDI